MGPDETKVEGDAPAAETVEETSTQTPAEVADEADSADEGDAADDSDAPAPIEG